MNDDLKNVENNDLVTLILYDVSTENNMNTKEQILLLNQFTKTILFYSDQQCCIDYIQSVEPKKKLFFITLAYDAMDILKLIHDLRQIDSVFIFCVNDEEQKFYDQLFPDEYWKIIDLCTNFNDLVESIKDNIELVQKETESFSYYYQHQKSIRELSREAALFLWLLLFKDVILELPHDEQAKNVMIEKFQQHYRNNKKQLKFIKEFSRTYKSRDAIQWYTEQPFLYKTINRALRTEDIEQLYIYRYFIVDLSIRLKEEHKTILEALDELTVYRGTKLSKQEIKKLSSAVGKLISTNGYLSTSCSKNVALMFATATDSSSTSVNDRQGVLFEIKCNLNELNDTVIFAHIAEFSKIPFEEEVLFDLGATFEILSVDPNTMPLTIKMKAVREGDTLAREYIQFNREEMEELKSPVLMYGRLLFDMGKFDQCQRYFQHLLNESLNNQEDIASLHVHLGRVHGEKGEFDDEFNHYNRALEIMKESGRTKDSAGVLNNIGSLCFDKGEFNKSLEYYQKALVIQRKYLPKYHQSTAMSLMNMGFVYYQKLDYDRSLIYHIQSLQMKQQILPSNHTLIADSIEHLGNVYWSQNQFNKCLKKYEQTLKMREKLLPRIHIDIAKSLMNLGNVLCDLGRQNDGLESYKNALLIQQELFPKGHPSVALTLSNISATYAQARHFTLAREYNKKALDMFQQFKFTNDHPHMIAVYNTDAEIDRLEHNTREFITQGLHTTSVPSCSFMRSSLFLTSDMSYVRLCCAHFFPLFSFVPFKCIPIDFN